MQNANFPVISVKNQQELEARKNFGNSQGAAYPHIPFIIDPSHTDHTDMLTVLTKGHFITAALSNKQSRCT